MRDCRRSSSISTSPTPCVSSLPVVDTLRAHSFRLDDARHRDDLVASHHERPAFAVGARDLCVDEHVLDLPRASGKPVTGPPPPYLKPCERGFDTPAAPRDRPSKLDRGRLEPEAGVLAHRPDTPPQLDPA